MMNEEQINESVMKTIRFRILQIEKKNAKSHEKKDAYKSVKTNGTGYLLTSVKMEDYAIFSHGSIDMKKANSSFSDGMKTVRCFIQ